MTHKCDMSSYPFNGYGCAVEICEENELGEFWVMNSEYATQVNYCPACGEKATIQVNEDKVM